MSKKIHLEEIDILKGIAITYVIIGHAVIVYPINLHDVSWCKTVYDFVRTTHMPLFFMIAGFCYSYKGDYVEYIQKKIFRLLIPYVVFSLIDSVPRALFSSLFNRTRDIADSMYTMFFFGGAKWFLFSLFMVFLLFPLISTCINYNKQIYWAVLFFLCLLKFIPGLPEIFLIRRTIYHFLYFAIGYGLKLYNFPVLTVINNLKKHRIAVICLAVSIFFLILLLVPYYAVENDQRLGIPLALLGIVFSFLVMTLLAERKASRIFVGFGIYSLQLYLFNSYFLGASRWLIVIFLKQTDPFLIIACNIAASLVLSYFFIKYVIDRFKITRFVSGIV